MTVGPKKAKLNWVRLRQQNLALLFRACARRSLPSMRMRKNLQFFKNDIVQQ